MSAWTHPRDLKARLNTLWRKGRLLSAPLTGEAPFPLRVPLKHPGPRELGEQYGAVRAWIDSLVSQAGSAGARTYGLEWREVNHRQLGRNRLPVAAVFEQAEDAFRFIGKQKQADRFGALSRQILERFPELGDWLARKPLIAVEYEESWPRLMAVLQWLRDHPRPRIYIRQLEIAGVDTKFVERHKKLLAELLDVVLPAGAVDERASGVAGFERRYGFLAKPARVRFRLLDPDLFICGLADFQIPADDFAALDPPGLKQVFITENEINGLAFPLREKSLVIFGLGYGLDLLTAAGWLTEKNIYYWGDIDTHGFAMLDQIRHAFPQTCSLLMDLGTLMDHRDLWGREQAPLNRDLPLLDPAEAFLYDGLRQDRWASSLRLEQERISYACLKTSLTGLNA
jgi:hypothetical protein